MHFRFYVLPRGLIFQIGRSTRDYRTIGLGLFWPFFITWRTVFISMVAVPNEPCVDCTHDYCRCQERAAVDVPFFF